MEKLQFQPASCFVVRLREFHASMSYLSAISKLFEDGGLKVIVIISLQKYSCLQE